MQIMFEWYRCPGSKIEACRVEKKTVTRGLAGTGYEAPQVNLWLLAGRQEIRYEM
jgi:hypothetical protein